MDPEQIVRRPLKTRQAKWAGDLTQILVRRGIRPNTISLFSIICALFAWWCFVNSAGASLVGRGALLILAALGIQLRLLCNMMDGLVAVEGGFRTKTGEIFNDFPDRIADSMILIGAGYAAGATFYSIELGWLAALLAVMTAYVRLLGGATGVTQHFIGPMAKPHRMATLTVATLLAAFCPSLHGQSIILILALWLIILGCVVTLVRRTMRIMKELDEQ